MPSRMSPQRLRACKPRGNLSKCITRLSNEQDRRTLCIYMGCVAAYGDTVLQSGLMNVASEWVLLVFLNDSGERDTGLTFQQFGERKERVPSSNLKEIMVDPSLYLPECQICLRDKDGITDKGCLWHTVRRGCRVSRQD